MSSIRFWVFLLALVSFLAGFAGGVLGGPRLAPARGGLVGAEGGGGAFPEFERRFRESFELSDEATRNLRFVLDRYRRDVEELKARRVREVESELVELGLTCRERIKKYVLQPDQIEDFEALAAGLAVPEDRL